MKVVYRRYASLFFLVGIDDEEASMPPPSALSRCQESPLRALGIHSPSPQPFFSVSSKGS